MKIDDCFARNDVCWAYPTFLNDKLIKNILDTGIELAISLHAKPMSTTDALKKIKTVKSEVYVGK